MVTAGRDWLGRKAELDPGRVTGVAKVDTRTKRLVKRIQPGDVMVIDHLDLDRDEIDSRSELRRLRQEQMPAGHDCAKRKCRPHHFFGMSTCVRDRTVAPRAFTLTRREWSRPFRSRSSGWTPMR